MQRTIYLNCAGGAANKAPPCLEAARDGAKPSNFCIFCLKRKICIRLT